MPYTISVCSPSEVNPPSNPVVGEGGRWISSRRAVATEYEARTVVRDHVVAAGIPHGTTSDPFGLDGGTVGPLPDGTVIEVKLTTLPELAVAARVPLPDFSMRTLDGVPADTARIIDAYNARQED